jgi:membrane protein YdbS with pleckstrin-like domain
MPQLNRHLRADEKVLWSSKPIIMPFILSNLVIIPFALIWLVFSIFMLLSAFSIGPLASSFVIFSLLFMLVGVGIIFSPILFELLRYRNTEYMITDQRIITQTGVIGLDTRFVDLSKIQEVYVTIGWMDKIYGTGSIIAVTAGFVPVGTSGLGGHLIRPAFKAITQPYEVQKILQDAIKKATMHREDKVL